METVSKEQGSLGALALLPTTLHGFLREDLAAMADGLDAGYDQTVNVGNAAGEGQGASHVESTTAAAARFIRAALAASEQQAPLAKPVAWAVFASNGNVRIWSRDPNLSDWSAQQGLPLTPLYVHPQYPAPLVDPIAWVVFGTGGTVETWLSGEEHRKLAAAKGQSVTPLYSEPPATGPRPLSIEQAQELARNFRAGYGYGPKGSAQEWDRCYTVSPLQMAAIINAARGTPTARGGEHE